MTTFNDVNTGEFLGFTFGVGPGVSEGLSVTTGATGVFSIREFFENLFNKKEPCK